MLKLLSSRSRNSILLQTLKIPTSHYLSVIPPFNRAVEEAKEDHTRRSSQVPIQRPSSGNGDITQSESESESGFQISHPWPEWIHLMKKLLNNGYFVGVSNPFLRNTEVGSKGSNKIRTACLNFARDQFDLLRYLSLKDIEVIVQAGCPSIDRKVINSGKRLRAHVGIDEGNVCRSCILRGNCERAYVKAREDEAGRTVDVMRFLLTYGLDPISGLVENKPCLNKKIEESIRKLLKEIVDFSREEVRYETQNASNDKTSCTGEIAQNHRDTQMNAPVKQGDWLCTKCNFLNFCRNIKCLRCNGLSEERLCKLKNEQDNLPLKKGDWICDKCNFLNFAKNTRCLRCKENPPKRPLHPGEWECESCNYINFKRNMICLKCDHRRPRVSKFSGSSQPANHSTNNYLNRPHLGSEKQFRDGFYEPKFVKSDSEDPDDSEAWNQETGYVDFSILGGKSDLSWNEQKREKWKKEMQEKGSSAAKANEKAHEFKSCFAESSNHFQFTDDEEMADWFGHCP